jgi:Holliday junction resolvase RusA-like endonuclease
MAFVSVWPFWPRVFNSASVISKFVIAGRLAGLNEIIASANTHRYSNAKLKKAETSRCAYAVMAGDVQTFSVPVKVHFRWIEPNNRRDIDNISAGAKFVLDALVMLHKIPNDTRQWVKGLSHEFPAPEAQAARVEVILEES